MKRWIFTGLIVVSAAVATAGAREKFSRGLRPEEFTAAGLDKLSAKELAQLDALFQKYGAPLALSGPAMPASPEPRQSEIDAAAVRVAEAEARAKKAEQELAVARTAAQAAQAGQKKAEEGFLAKAKKVFVSPGTKVEIAAMETEIDGSFDGWDATTMWRMTDGSVWGVDNKPQPYAVKRVKNPKVKIYPASLSGYWVEFVELDLKLRVRPVPMN